MALKSLLSPLTIFIAMALASSNGQNQWQSPSTSSATMPTKLKYHGGALLTQKSGINIYLIWYGGFSRKDRASISNFFASFDPHNGLVDSDQQPTVSTWWSTVQSYKDKAGNPVPSNVKVVKQVGDLYSLGKNLKRAQIANVVRNKIDNGTLPLDLNGIYLILTAKDVIVERFCMGSCGFHDSFMVPIKGRVVYAHVGDPVVQCPGLCAWPYAIPSYGPPGQALVAPNGVGGDGMIMNIATILAGAATNPYKTGYFQGDTLAPLEAVTACAGIFGSGAYPGYPGNLMVDKISKASYNAYSTGGSKFLLPAMWDPLSLMCKVMA